MNVYRLSLLQKKIKVEKHLSLSVRPTNYLTISILQILQADRYFENRANIELIRGFLSSKVVLFKPLF